MICSDLWIILNSSILLFRLLTNIFRSATRAIYNPDEYAMYDHTNTSMIEQWHAVIETLATTVKGSSLPHAMFLLQTLQDDHYRTICEKNQYPAEAQAW